MSDWREAARRPPTAPRNRFFDDGRTDAEIRQDDYDLRDQRRALYAAAALTGLLACPEEPPAGPQSVERRYAERAHEYAAEMLRAHELAATDAPRPKRPAVVALPAGAPCFRCGRWTLSTIPGSVHLDGGRFDCGACPR